MNVSIILESIFKLQEHDLKGNKEGGSSAAELRSNIPEPFLGHYDRCLARGKTALALVRNQVCGGCHMRLPVGTVNALVQATDIHICENCGRYLYLDTRAVAVDTPKLPTPGKTKSRRKKMEKMADVGG